MGIQLQQQVRVVVGMAMLSAVFGTAFGYGTKTTFYAGGVSGVTALAVDYLQKMYNNPSPLVSFAVSIPVAVWITGVDYRFLNSFLGGIAATSFLYHHFEANRVLL